MGHYSWIDLSIGMLEKYKGLPLPKNFDPFTVAKSVATHESIHKLAHSRKKYYADGSYSDGLMRIKDDIVINRGLNETVTEMLTEKSLGTNNYPNILYCGYQPAVTRFKVLIDSGFISYEELKYAYFNSDTEYLPKVFENAYHSDKYESSFEEFSSLMDMAISSNPYEKSEGLKMLDEFIIKLSIDTTF